MFEINPGLIIWTMITFGVLVLVLGRFAWKPILKALNEREEKIRSAIEQADKARAEAAHLLKQNEKNMARAEAEYQKMMREARAMAEKMREDIVTKARLQAEQELKRANEEIQRNLEAAKQQLRSEVADLAVKAAEKILDETLDAQKHKKIVDGFLNQLPKN
ncbi:MAG: F0F1 ATP synthase subunit B [Ignavibacteriales bacterium]|nr:F0F1 ATP synthase subunit B [Ignavibacteriales bacterium]